MRMRLRAVKGKEEEIVVVASTAVITAYAAQGRMLAAREVLVGLLAIGIGVDAASWIAMIAGYAQNAQMEKAAELFGIMPPGKRNVVTWTAMISGYVRCGSAAASSALRLFYQMPVQQPNHVTFAALLPACQHLETLQGIHEQILRRGFQSNLFVCNGLVHMYAKLGAIGVARQVFDKMAERNVVSWTAMVASYARVDLREALRLFWRIPQPNVASWNAIIGGCMHHGFIAEALLLFHRMPRRNGVSWNIMIVGYAERGKTEEALKLPEQMPTTDTTVAVVSWNSVIAGFADKGEEEEALRVFRVMQRERESVMMKPNSKTFTLVLPLYGKRASLK
ncbi:pentatricopeptide repeat-containing protein At2g35030, mitochondrial-like [Cryptomeria japonica]|uniref:pentatricopeptide repeat-containing protein At2g35030, mitochondrial-like n=1 Tax=Cryptomeria japonica TaxID=3369 RepID=UPI0027D9D06C|nr:pentatricopeptide repeat-containing protein At2g35030, mitochondrial-like [Cryptomeria japonica]